MTDGDDCAGGGNRAGGRHAAAVCEWTLLVVPVHGTGPWQLLRHAPLQGRTLPSAVRSDRIHTILICAQPGAGHLLQLLTVSGHKQLLTVLPTLIPPQRLPWTDKIQCLCTERILDATPTHLSAIHDPHPRPLHHPESLSLCLIREEASRRPCALNVPT